jgi:hypothetical protein
LVGTSSSLTTVGSNAIDNSMFTNVTVSMVSTNAVVTFTLAAPYYFATTGGTRTIYPAWFGQYILYSSLGPKVFVLPALQTQGSGPVVLYPLATNNMTISVAATGLAVASADTNSLFYDGTIYYSAVMIINFMN